MNRLKNWYFLLWIVAAVLAGFIYFRAFKPRTFVGVVETKEHPVSSMEAGVISQLFVEIGDEVKTGQELAQIYSADVRDLDSFQAMAELLRIERTFRDELAGLEAKKMEINGLNAQISRLKNASDKGVISSQDMANLTIKRDALQKHVQEQLKLLNELERQYFVDQSSDGGKAAAGSHGKSAVIERYKEHLQTLRTRFVELEKRVNSGKVVSPCDGKVIAISFRSGDMVDAFQPFLTIVESSPTHMEAYIPENAELTLKEGVRVSIIPKRPGVKTSGGTVTFVHQEISPLPERLVVTRTQPWVRKIYIELDSPHDLLPGEKVRVKITSAKKGFSFGRLFKSANASAQNQSKIVEQQLQTPALQEIKVPSRLQKRVSFEPSGLLWLEDIDRFLVISDDTGRKPLSNHIPWLFLMDADGCIEVEPVVLNGVEKVNDLEAIADRGDGIIYILSSQSSNKEGERGKDRQLLMEIRRRGRQLSVLRKVEFFSAIVRSYDDAGLAQLGLTQTADNGALVLNIEGMAYRYNSLYLGLKEPVSDRGAIIWKLTDLGRVFENKNLSPAQLSLFARVDLGRHNGVPASISDMTFDDTGRLLILSTIAKAGEPEQMGGFHVIKDFHQGEMKAELLFNFPKYKPEGICLVKSGHLRIVFDTEEIPSFFTDIDLADKGK